MTFDARHHLADGHGRGRTSQRARTRTRSGTGLAAALFALSVATSLPAQGLFGPGKFHIEQSDDRFSTTGMTTRQGFNNRVTNKAAGGGLYIDWKGLYLDPMVIKDRASGKLVSVGFILHHETTSGIGVANTIGTPRSITFLLPDQRLIQIEVRDGDQHLGRTGNYDRYTRTVETDIREAGTLTLTPEDMKALATATSVTIHLEGSERGWTIEAKDIAKAFLPNLLTFYNQEIISNLPPQF